MTATARLIVGEGGFRLLLATSVASCRGDLASDCMEGMFAQQGMAAINEAAVACALMQQTPVQAGSEDARKTATANAIVAARVRSRTEFAGRNVTGWLNLRRTIRISPCEAIFQIALLRVMAVTRSQPSAQPNRLIGSNRGGGDVWTRGGKLGK